MNVFIKKLKSVSGTVYMHNPEIPELFTAATINLEGEIFIEQVVDRGIFFI